jgi:hypothetical protein
VSKRAIRFEAAKTLEETLSCLRAVGGIGESKAHYIALRACGDPDAFPYTDIGFRRSAGNGGIPVSPMELLRIAITGACGAHTPQCNCGQATQHSPIIVEQDQLKSSTTQESWPFPRK